VLLLKNLQHGIIANIIWGLTVLTILTVIIAQDRKESVARAIFEHLGTAVLVLVLSHLAGDVIAIYF
ncbi:MAG: hypothetical protein WC269_03250, partial [Candidatus Gracilibacteria bacterium]